MRIGVLGGSGFISIFQKKMRTKIRRRPDNEKRFCWHNAFMLGQTHGFVQVPAGRGYESTDSLARSDHMPLTRNLDLFYDTTQIEGVATDAVFSNFLFVSQCLSENDFGASSIAMTDPRMRHFTERLSASQCPLYHLGDPIATHGLHWLFDTTMTSLYQMSNS